MKCTDCDLCQEFVHNHLFIKNRTLRVALPITGFSRSDLALDLRLEPCFQKKDSWSKISLICIIFIPHDWKMSVLSYHVMFVTLKYIFGTTKLSKRTHKNRSR